jgi:hypothetical protein
MGVHQFNNDYLSIEGTHPTTGLVVYVSDTKWVLQPALGYPN